MAQKIDAGGDEKQGILFTWPKRGKFESDFIWLNDLSETKQFEGLKYKLEWHHQNLAP